MNNCLIDSDGQMHAHLGDLGVEVLHVVAQHLSKLAEDFLMPGVILQIHLGLDLWFSKVLQNC